MEFLKSLLLAFSILFMGYFFYILMYMLIIPYDRW